jgi:hypothetical protein
MDEHQSTYKFRVVVKYEAQFGSPFLVSSSLRSAIQQAFRSRRDSSPSLSPCERCSRVSSGTVEVGPKQILDVDTVEGH